jgi:hypothetical protein
LITPLIVLGAVLAMLVFIITGLVILKQRQATRALLGVICPSPLLRGIKHTHTHTHTHLSMGGKYRKMAGNMGSGIARFQSVILYFVAV